MMMNPNRIPVTTTKEDTDKTMMVSRDSVGWTSRYSMARIESLTKFDPRSNRIKAARLGPVPGHVSHTVLSCLTEPGEIDQVPTSSAN